MKTKFILLLLVVMMAGCCNLNGYKIVAYTDLDEKIEQGLNCAEVACYDEFAGYKIIKDKRKGRR